MLHIVILKKDSLQVVNDHIDGPVGDVPQAGIVTSSRGDDLQLHERLLEMWEQALPGRLFGGPMDHRFSVFLDGLRQPFHSGQGLPNSQGDFATTICSSGHLLDKWFFLCRTPKVLRIINQRQKLTLKPEGLTVSLFQLAIPGSFSFCKSRAMRVSVFSTSIYMKNYSLRLVYIRIYMGDGIVFHPDI